jgi:hypothetical protein
MAILGDDAHSGTANSGRVDFEVSEIVTADGDNEAWVTQTATIQAGHPTHGHGATLHFDFMFTFPGVATETIGDDPNPGTSSASRLQFLSDADPSTGILHSWQSSSSSMDVQRAYYQMVRVNGYLWIVGGNDGDGPVASIERTLQ